MTQWTSGSNTEFYVYDASGQRVLRRSTNSSTTQISTYPFGMSDFTYNSAGAETSSTYYYSLGGTLIGTLSGGATSFLMIDGLGSPLASISSTAGSAAVLGNQGYGLYGTRRYQQGILGTVKGFTRQYADDLSGLDYYVSRYYDPVVGRFLSADTAQGDMQGMDPYGYVGGNPETSNDPTGKFIADSNGTGYRKNTHTGVPYRKWVPFQQDTQDWSPLPPTQTVTCTPRMPGCYGPPAPPTRNSSNRSQVSMPPGSCQPIFHGCIPYPNTPAYRKAVNQRNNDTSQAFDFIALNSVNLAFLFVRGEGDGVDPASGDQAALNSEEENALLNDENASSDPLPFGEGVTFSHFTNAEGVSGITGIDAGSLKVGQTVTVNQLNFGEGSNPFMSEQSGDIFVTELGANASSRQLAQIGVFGDKQNYVIQFSQESAIYE